MRKPSMQPWKLVVLGAVGLTPALVPGIAAAAPLVHTYVITVGGRSQLLPNFGCSTFHAPPEEGNFFADAGVGFGVSIPTEGLATCGVGGSYRAQDSSVGPLTDSASLTTAFDSNTFVGSAA